MFSELPNDSTQREVADRIEQLILSLEDPRAQKYAYATSRLLEHFGESNLLGVFQGILGRGNEAQKQFVLQELGKLGNAAQGLFEEVLPYVQSSDSGLAMDAVFCLIKIDKIKLKIMLQTLKGNIPIVNAYLDKLRKK